MTLDSLLSGGDDDDVLVADLRRVLGAIDAVPEPARIAARAALDWRTLDAELAALVHDTNIDAPLHAVRGVCEARALTFELADLTIEVDAEPDEGGDEYTLAGQLVPPQPAEVIIRSADQLLATRADDRGQFVARGVGAGKISLRCRLDDSGTSRLVETAWLTI